MKYLVLLLFIAGCKSPEKKSLVIEERENVLRITYDSAYYLHEDEKLVSKEKNSSGGNSYQLSIPEFKSVKISSYAEENKLIFSYLHSGEFRDIKYIKMGNNTNAYIVFLKTNNEYYSRWEWNYKGQGIVIESVADKEFSREDIEKRIRTGLKIYY